MSLSSILAQDTAGVNRRAVRTPLGFGIMLLDAPHGLWIGLPGGETEERVNNRDWLGNAHGIG